MLAIALLVSLSILPDASSSAQDPVPATTHAPHAKVAGCAKPVPIVSGADHRVSCQVRTGPGEVELHVKETDVFYITGGAATFVTGGTIVGRAPGANANQIKGTSIDGGETRELSEGDVIIIPAGVPHWFKEVKPRISMISVKVIKP